MTPRRRCDNFGDFDARLNHLENTARSKARQSSSNRPPKSARTRHGTTEQLQRHPSTKAQRRQKQGSGGPPENASGVEMQEATHLLPATPDRSLSVSERLPGQLKMHLAELAPAAGNFKDRMAFCVRRAASVCEQSVMRRRIHDQNWPTLRPRQACRQIRHSMSPSLPSLRPLRISQTRPNKPTGNTTKHHQPRRQFPEHQGDQRHGARPKSSAARESRSSIPGDRGLPAVRPTTAALMPDNAACVALRRQVFPERATRPRPAGTTARISPAGR